MRQGKQGNARIRCGGASAARGCTSPLGRSGVRAAGCLPAAAPGPPGCTASAADPEPVPGSLPGCRVEAVMREHRMLQVRPLPPLHALPHVASSGRGRLVLWLLPLPVG